MSTTMPSRMRRVLSRRGRRGAGTAVRLTVDELLGAARVTGREETLDMEGYLDFSVWLQPDHSDRRLPRAREVVHLELDTTSIP